MPEAQLSPEMLARARAILATRMRSPERPPFLPGGQGGMQELLARMGLNVPAQPQPLRDPMQALGGAQTIGAGQPSTMNRLSSIIPQLIASMRERFSGLGGDKVSDQSLSDLITGGVSPAPRGDVQLPPQVAAALQRRVGPARPSPAIEQPPFMQEGGEAPFGTQEAPVRATEGPPLDARFQAFQGATPDMFGLRQSPSAMGYPLAPQGPSRWASFGGAILQGLTESMVPAIVSFAADRTNNPEMVRAWSESQAIKMQQADQMLKMQIAEMNFAGDLLNAQRAWEQLEVSKTNGRVSVLNQANQIMKDTASTDPMTAIKSLQGLGAAYVSLGGDLDEFAASNPLPSIGILRSLRSQADDQFKRFAADPSALGMASIPNPFGGDPLTPLEVYEMLGEVDLDTGRVIMPLGVVRPADIVERTSRDFGGVERQTTMPVGEAMRTPTVRQPTAGELSINIVGRDKKTGDLIVNIINRRSGAVVRQTRLSGQDLPGVSSIEQMTESITRPMAQREAVRQELIAAGVEDPTDEEIDDVLEGR